MGLFNRKPAPAEDTDWGTQYDPEQHELIEVKGRDGGGETKYEYIRDKRTQQIIGTPNWSFRVRPLESEHRR
jgi:hypothetical protein